MRAQGDTGPAPQEPARKQHKPSREKWDGLRVSQGPLADFISDTAFG